LRGSFSQIPGTKVPASQYETLRNGEVIKQYYAGAYVDPNNPNIRHNPHDIQRLEQAATWNLRPTFPLLLAARHMSRAPPLRRTALSVLN
jgi:hypothetical protein